MITILSTIFVLGVLVFVHELGHFLAAKLFRIRVDRFSMGYHPRLIGKKIGDTDYCISLIPFGGYVKIAGMVDESFDEEQLQGPPQPWEFRSKPWWQRMTVIFAGPLMNLVLALVIFIGMIYYYGVGELHAPVVNELLEGKPAAEAGLLPGDRITAIDDQKISSWEDMVNIIRESPNQILHLTWMRGDSVLSGDVVPAAESVLDTKTGEMIEVGQIGISGLVEFRKAGVFEGIQMGAERLYDLTKMIFLSLGRLITGKESVKNLSGPVLIAKMAGESARSGWGSLIAFMAFLSLNLGIINLLPIPVLDGGHLLFLSIESIIRKELPVKAKLIIQQVGMFLLIALMVFVVYNDIVKIIH